MTDKNQDTSTQLDIELKNRIHEVLVGNGLTIEGTEIHPDDNVVKELWARIVHYSESKLQEQARGLLKQKQRFTYGEPMEGRPEKTMIVVTYAIPVKAVERLIHD